MRVIDSTIDIDEIDNIDFIIRFNVCEKILTSIKIIDICKKLSISIKLINVCEKLSSMLNIV